MVSFARGVVMNAVELLITVWLWGVFIIPFVVISSFFIGVLIVNIIVTYCKHLARLCLQ
jgi:hypothetical protein